MVIAMTTLLFAGCASQADVFATDPEAPLAYGASGATVTADDWSTMTAEWTENRPEITYAVDVCLRADAEVTNVTLVSFTPYEKVGEYNQLPALLITAPDDRDAFISVDGYPPSLSTASEQSAFEGEEFTHRCGQDEPFQQIAVGLRGLSDVGGGWRGAVLRYQAGGQEYTLNLPTSFFLCGTATEPCDG